MSVKSLSNVKSTSDETSTISWELTKKKGFRAGHRNSAERKLESTNEILNSLGDDASSVSKQRATLIFVELVLAGLDKTLAAISPKIEASTHMSKMI